LEKIASVEQFCPHFHLSLQSGSDSVLKRMNRKYSAEEYYERVQLIRNYFNNPSFTTDVIVGFPGETKEEFVQTLEDEGIHYILCNQLETLIWLGNQLAIEFHIPFQTIKSKGPSEIVFDLDPPSKNEFQLAIKAALIIKDVLDQLKLVSFIKTSGNKGLQIYIPLPENVYSYDDTRLFTSFVAEYLVSRNPDSFTIERMKKKRGNRLYVDYVQHSEGKTIVAPYSMRGNEHAGVATPLYWEEVNDKLVLETFNFQTALKRIKNQGNPFKDYFQTKNIQLFSPVLEFIKETRQLTNH
jgi:bifunctional non-homologous end joining protein LigD